jgi:hypothetical protein
VNPPAFKQAIDQFKTFIESLRLDQLSPEDLDNLRSLFAALEQITTGSPLIAGTGEGGALAFAPGDE